MKKITFTLAIAAIFTTAAHGQDFLNLNFESAYNLPGNPPIPDGTDVAAANALPSWTAYDGALALTDINYVSNYISGVSTAVELEGGSLALSGSFSVGLYGGSISQTGLVPDNAESLQFEAYPAFNLDVTLGGQRLSYSILSQGPDYTVFGANIPSGMDGQSEALTFSVFGAGGQALLDNIEFSTSSVPEPGECGLIGIGLVLFPAFAQKLRRGKGPRRVA